MAAVKENLPKPDDNPLAGLFSSCKSLPLCQTYLLPTIEAMLGL